MLRRLVRLQPPAGGEARLRRALHAASVPKPRAAWAFAAVAAGAGVVALLAWHAPRPDAKDAQIRQAVQRAVAPKPEFRLPGARVERVATRDPDVRLYRIVALRAVHPAVDGLPSRVDVD